MKQLPRTISTQCLVGLSFLLVGIIGCFLATLQFSSSPVEEVHLFGEIKENAEQQPTDI
jgi:hypothetical protein